MGRPLFILLASAIVVLAPFTTQAAHRIPAPRAVTAKKAADPLRAAKSIEPIEAPDKPTRAGWSGFYFGVNAGAARTETIR